MNLSPALKTWLKIGISAVMLTFLFTNTGIQQTFEELSSANLWYIPLVVAVYLAGQILSAYRWQILSRPLGFPLSLREFYDYYLIGMYFNLFLPSAIGGDVGRIYYLAKGGNRRKREAALTILADRGTGLVSLLGLASAVCLMPVASILPQSLRWTLLGLFFAGIVLYILLRLTPLEGWLARMPKLGLVAQARVYWRDFPLLFQAVLVSTCYHLLMIWVHLMIAQALSVQVDALFLTMVYGVVSLVSVIPVSFNGIGLREGAYQYLLVQYGMVPHTALAFGLYWFIISTLTSLVGGIVLIKGHYQTPKAEELEAEPG